MLCASSLALSLCLRASSEIRVVELGDEFETQLDAFLRQWHEIVLADGPGEHSQRVNRLSLKLNKDKNVDSFFYI